MPRKCWRRLGGPSAYLPENPSETSKDQKAVSRTGRVGLGPGRQGHLRPAGPVCRDDEGQAWTPATLKEVGGTEGVGVTFLEETFSAATAPPEHRYHQKAARAVLKALLPESGTRHQGPHAVVCRVAGSVGLRQPSQGLRRPDPHSRQRNPAHHADRSRRARTRAADSASQAEAGAEILPTDPRLSGALVAGLADPQAEGNAARPGRTAAGGSGGGVERPPGEPATAVAVAVVADPVADAEEELDAAAAEDDGEGGPVSCGAGLGRCLDPGPARFGRLGRPWPIEGTSDCGIVCWKPARTEVPGIVKDMAPYRRWLDPLLHEAYAQAEASNDPRKQLHASLALLPVDSGQVEYLYGRLAQGASRRKSS